MWCGGGAVACWPLHPAVRQPSLLAQRHGRTLALRTRNHEAAHGDVEVQVLYRHNRHALRGRAHQTVKMLCAGTVSGLPPVHGGGGQAPFMQRGSGIPPSSAQSRLATLRTNTTTPMEATVSLLKTRPR